MTYEGFANLDCYPIAPADVYGSNWAASLRTLLSSDLNLYTHAFKPPVKGQRFVEDCWDMAIAIAGSDFPAIQPRIILGKRTFSDRGDSKTVTANPPYIQCYCPACVAARLKQADPPAKWNKQPRIGSIVHYTDCHDVIVPAIVLKVYDGSDSTKKSTIYLQIFGARETYCAAAFGHTSGTWHWPSDS